MNRTLKVLAVAVAAAGGIAGCASAPATPTAASAEAAPPAAPATPAGAPATRNPGDGYKAVNRKGQQLYCKRELLTGSRTNSVETCLTAQQMEQQRNNVDALLRRVQDMNNGRPGTEASGGQFNNVMSTSGRPGGQ